MAQVGSVAVVGASLAGLRAAETLRRKGFAGRLTLVGAEPHRPYDRPPLSKELLAGACGPDDIGLARDGLAGLDADLRLGTAAVALDAAERTLELADGTRLAADGIVVATGSRPRRLPDQPDLAGIHVLRTVDDALAIRADLERGGPVVVVGAGFIGAEVAATCRGRGLDVTLLEALEQPMVRGLGAGLGAVIADLHRDHGVDLRLGAQVAGFEGGDRVTGVRLGDGETVAADTVVVGIGVEPVTAWLEGSGLTLDDGVVCDETCLAAPGIVAAGDVCRWPNPLFDGRSMRLEHWTNAVEQGVHAAGRLLAGDDRDEVAAFAPVPFVWSDQYDVKIQTVGVVGAGDGAAVAITHGTTEERRFVALFGRDDRLVGALGFGRPRQVMGFRRMIAERASWADALAAADR